MAQLNANITGTWSVTAESEEEVQEYVEGLNFCLEHPELNTPEKIDAWFAEQKAEKSEDDEA